MTTTAAAAPTASSYARIPAAFRLQFSVPSALIWVPLMIFYGIWLIVVGVGFWVRSLADGAIEDPIYTGASQAALWTLLFMAAYAASHTFPFAMALSYSRRVFVIGAFLAFAAVSAGFGASFALAAVVERMTGGFGVEFYTFDLPSLTEGPGGILSAGLLAAALCLTLMLMGFFWAILYRRVSVATLWGVVIGVVLLLLAAVMLITQVEGWAGLWTWLGEQSALTFAGWLAVAALGLGVADYLIIRRATPGS